MRTAYVELNASNQICSLAPGTGNDAFSYMGITMFPCITLTSLPELLRMDYDYFILDMGVLNTYSAREFIKCEKQFLVCSLSKWRKKRTLEKLEKLQIDFTHNRKILRILGCGSEKESNLSLSKGPTFKTVPIPFIPNPFHLPLELFSFFRKILGVY